MTVNVLYNMDEIVGGRRLARKRLIRALKKLAPFAITALALGAEYYLRHHLGIF